MSNDAAPDQPSGQMRAFRVEKGAREVKLQNINIPKVGPEDVLIEVRSVILAPDVFRLAKMGKIPQAPTTLGHKVAGTIAAVGSSVSNIHPGQRVRLDPNLSCGNCVYCRTDRDHMCSECGVMGFFSLETFPRWERYHPGGLADYVLAPATQVGILPENLSFDVGAVVHDLANAVRALKNTSVGVGSTLLITAATGAMGACVVKMAPFFGVTRLILVARQLERLKETAKMSTIPCTLIATEKLDKNWTTEQGLGNKVCELVPGGVDAIIDYSPPGVADLWQALDGLKIGGSFVHMGGNPDLLPYGMRTFGLKCWRLIGTRNHSKTDSRAVIQILADGTLDVSDMITHEFKLSDVEAGAQQLEGRMQHSRQIMVRP